MYGVVSFLLGWLPVVGERKKEGGRGEEPFCPPRQLVLV
jgi:hypothetical protein